jgi:DNA-binding MarR family transcriptional regulator
MLDDLERQGYIKRLPVDKRKVLASLQLAQRDITYRCEGYARREP